MYVRSSLSVDGGEGKEVQWYYYGKEAETMSRATRASDQ